MSSPYLWGNFPGIILKAKLHFRQSIWRPGYWGHRLPTSIGSCVRFNWPHVTGESQQFVQTLLDIELGQTLGCKTLVLQPLVCPRKFLGSPHTAPQQCWHPRHSSQRTVFTHCPSDFQQLLSNGQQHRKQNEWQISVTTVSDCVWFSEIRHMYSAISPWVFVSI